MLLSGAHLRLGELLLDVGLIRQEDIADAVRISQRNQLPIGRALVMQGRLSEDMLQAALEAQSLYRDGLMTKRETLQALKSVKTTGVGLSDAVEQLKLVTRAADFADIFDTGTDIDIAQDTTGMSTVGTSGATGGTGAAATKTDQSKRVLQTGQVPSERQIKRNRLGELLLAAGIVTKPQIELHLENSTRCGLPLGRYLVSTGAVSEPLISTALNIQLMIRNWKMTRDQGIEALKSAKRRQLRNRNADDTIELPIINTMHLGELLVMSKILTQPDMMHAVEVSLLNEEHMGQALLRLNLISNGLLQDALTIQHMLIVGRLQPHQAVEALKAVYHEQKGLSDALTRVQHSQAAQQERMSFETFLRFTGVIPRELLDKAVATSEASGTSIELSDVLVAYNFLSRQLLRSCQVLHSLVGNGNLTLEKAIVVLKQCVHTGKTVREVIGDFNWTLQAKEQL